MSVLPVVKYGNSILKRKMSPVRDFDSISTGSIRSISTGSIRGLSELVENMFDTMYEEEGIGLAANQVGVDLNLMVIDITHVSPSTSSGQAPSTGSGQGPEDGSIRHLADNWRRNPDQYNRPLVFINGEILKGWGDSTMEEGCLSLPGIRVDVKRFDTVRFAFQEVSGERHVEEFQGLLSRVIQHEMDHLNGLVILDRVSPLTRQRFSQQLKQIASH